MKTNQWQGKISRAVFMFTLLFIAAIVLSATAYAQNRYPNNDQNRRDGNFDHNSGGCALLHPSTLDRFGSSRGIGEGITRQRRPIVRCGMLFRYESGADRRE